MAVNETEPVKTFVPKKNFIIHLQCKAKHLVHKSRIIFKQTN